MKSFIYKVFFLALLSMVLVTALKLAKPKNYNSAMVDKLLLLKKYQHQRKIVLIGGSSVGWGISAKQIEDTTHLPTINLGLHAGFGLMDFQSFVQSMIQPDDIIIFSPEWIFYENPNYHDPATLQDLYSNSAYLDLTEKSTYTKFSSLFLRRVMVLNYVELHPEKSPYRYDCMNKNGDIVSHCGLKPTGPEDYVISFERFNFEQFKQAFPFVTRPNTFIVFPPTQKRIYVKNVAKLNQLQAILSKHNLHVVNSVEENVHESSDFFDLQYHLTCEVREKRTETIIQYLRAFLKTTPK
ncbi:hypothetical protein VR479_07400 [Aquirufa aurantiipilula]